MICSPDNEESSIAPAAMYCKNRAGPSYLKFLQSKAISKGRAVHENSSRAPKIAEHGIVSTQAQTIFFAIPHRTAESLLTDPAPIIAPVIVWVVLSGMPKRDRKTIVTPPPVSAQKPPIGWSFVKRIPSVFTILHPPK